MASITRISRQPKGSRTLVTAVDDPGRVQPSHRRVPFLEGRDVTPPDGDHPVDPMPRSQRNTTNANSTGRFLSVDQAATELEITPDRCQRMIRTGQIAAIKIGGLGIWRIERTTVSALTSSHE